MTGRVGQGWAAVFLCLAALIAAGCVGASATARVSASTAAPIETASPSGAATEAPTVSGPAPAASSDTWKSIQWTALPATAASGAKSPDAGSAFQFFGWSRGYVGLSVTGRTNYSADGVHWHLGQPLDTSLSDSEGQLEMFRSVIEGPSGLLAVGWTEACASDYLESLWTSPDGIVWHPVDVSKAFGSATIVHVSGGPAGYVAVAFRGGGTWTSLDGQTWRPVQMNAGPFANASIDDGTAVSGGFVLAGTSGTPDCSGRVTPDQRVLALAMGARHDLDENFDTSPQTPSVWWSADSSSWTRAALPGAVARSQFQVMWQCHVSEHSLLVVDDSETGRLAWGSNDGRTWESVSFPGDVDQRDVIWSGHHNLVVEPTGDPSQLGELRLRSIDDHFDLVSVSQHGDVPRLEYSIGWGDFAFGLVAVGPTGVLVTNADGSRIWFGTASV